MTVEIRRNGDTVVASEPRYMVLSNECPCSVVVAGGLRGDTVVASEPRYTVLAEQSAFSVSVASAIIMVDSNPFPGPYNIRPNFSSQILGTAHKTMTSDLEVQPIPVSEVTNASGGWTMTIGD